MSREGCMERIKAHADARRILFLENLERVRITIHCANI